MQRVERQLKRRIRVGGRERSLHTWEMWFGFFKTGGIWRHGAETVQGKARADNLKGQLYAGQE